MLFSRSLDESLTAKLTKVRRWGKDGTVAWERQTGRSRLKYEWEEAAVQFNFSPLWTDSPCFPPFVADKRKSFESWNVLMHLLCRDRSAQGSGAHLR